ETGHRARLRPAPLRGARHGAESHRPRQGAGGRGREGPLRRTSLRPEGDGMSQPIFPVSNSNPAKDLNPMRFTKDHEWVEVDGDVATVGITAYAAEQLGDVVFVETPDVGKTVKAGDGFAVVESVKAASD